MFEKKHQKIAPMPVFIGRIANYTGLVTILVLSALGIGIVGYHVFAGLPWIDSLLNASMILGGMGQIDTLTTSSAKVFASIYALFSGLVVIAAMSIFLMPFLHRVLHKFHLEDK